VVLLVGAEINSVIARAARDRGAPVAIPLEDDEAPGGVPASRRSP
jgi:hypothetical protein